MKRLVHPLDAALSPETAEVVTHDYEGPNRRRRRHWLAPRKVRLDDVDVGGVGEGESIETLLRRIGLWGGLEEAGRDRRAKFVATLETLAERGRRDAHPVWPEIVTTAAHYIRAVGADGRIDEPLLNDALHAAQAAHAEYPCARPRPDMLARLERAARAAH